MSAAAFKFNIGDVVRLNSGGSAMTVFERSGPTEFRESTIYECEWHSADGLATEGTYDERCLTKVETT